jgi:hypothetical protein
MDKLYPAGLNLGSVFYFTYGCLSSTCRSYTIKLPNLKVKHAETNFGLSPISFCAPPTQKKGFKTLTPGVFAIALANEATTSNQLSSDPTGPLGADPIHFDVIESVNETLGHGQDSHHSYGPLSIENEVKEERREAETNLILCATFVMAYSSFSFMPDLTILLIVSVMKSATPIVTALINFGKLQTVAKLYWENSVHIFNRIVS